MILRSFFALALLLLFNACSHGPDLSKLPKEQHDVIVLGGSTFGLTVVTALKAYDESIDVVLVEPSDDFIIEPYINLYLAGKMDAKLLFRPLANIAKRHSFIHEKKPVVMVETGDKKRVVLDDRVLYCKRLVDARYRYRNTKGQSSIVPERPALEALKERLGDHGIQRLLIDASALTKPDLIRAQELYNILQGQRTVLLSEDDGTHDGVDMVIRYPEYPEGSFPRFSDNFFVQFNEGLEMTARIVKEDFKGSYLPNMVKEERFIYQNAETLQGIDPDTNSKREGTEYLSKVMKIQRDFF